MKLDGHIVAIQALCGILLLSLSSATGALGGSLQETSAGSLDTRQIFVLYEKGELTATSWTGRGAVVRLRPSEKVVRSKVGRTIAIYVTNKRYLGYNGSTNKWSYVRRKTSEKCTDLRVEDHNGLVLTNKRIITYNGRTWAGKNRRR